MKKYIFLSVALFIAAINFNLILKPLELVTGGTQGLALLINHLFKLKPSIIILIINIITLVLSYFFLDKSVTYGSLVATFLYPLFVRITSFIPDFTLVHEWEIVFVLIAGIVCGNTGGYIYKLGFSSGGISTVNLLVNKYLNIRVASSNFIINFLIIVGGCFFFGVKKALYSVLVILISSYIIYLIIGRYKSHNIS